MDDFVFTDGEAKVHPAPKYAWLLSGFRMSLPQTMDLSTSGLAQGLAGFRHPFEAAAQNFHTACLVDKVDRTLFEGKFCTPIDQPRYQDATMQ